MPASSRARSMYASTNSSPVDPPATGPRYANGVTMTQPIGLVVHSTGAFALLRRCVVRVPFTASSALTHLLSEVPAAVFAKATGYSPAPTPARAARAGHGLGENVRRKMTPQNSPNDDYAAHGSRVSTGKARCYTRLLKLSE